MLPVVGGFCSTAMAVVGRDYPIVPVAVIGFCSGRFVGQHTDDIVTAAFFGTFGLVTGRDEAKTAKRKPTLGPASVYI